MAQILNVSATTIRRRLNNLIRNNVIRIVALTDTEKAGYPVVVGIAIAVDPDKINGSVAKMASHPNVKSIGLITGIYNLNALTVFRSTEELSAFIQTFIATMDGVRSVETHIFLQMWKGRYMHGSL